MIHKFAFVFSMILLAIAMANSSFAKWDIKPLSSFDPQVKELLSKMTLDEKIGQMTQPDQEALADTPEDVKNLFIGSVLSGGNSDPKEGNTLKAWTDLYDRMQKQALKTRLRIPILYGIDAVHGHSNVLGAVIFPHNIGLGCARDPYLIEEISRITALEVRATGINWTFAPCVTVPQDERWGRTYEGFSEDPILTELYGEASVIGLQGFDLRNPLKVLACAKHYLGDGGTAFGTGIAENIQGNDQGDAQVDEATLRRIHLQPYYAAIAAGAGSIMPSYSSWNGKKVSGDHYLMTDVLKGELGFEGFLISDYNAIDQVDPDYKTAIKKSINAGMDMAMVPHKYKEYISLLKELAAEGQVPMERIDDAVTRILRAKFAMGLMDKSASQLADRSLHESFGSKEHRDVARAAVRQSLVLLKNKNNVLPLSKNLKRIHVAGKSANNIGDQCGGWTIAWQGETGGVTEGGTTLWHAISNAVSLDTVVTFTPDGSSAGDADVGIVVVGEEPYAEMMGDRADLRLSHDDIMAINRMKNAGMPVVVILLSGRPMIINEALETADAFIAAWLPGTEGQGVSDVLFGDFAPTGKLSYSWPRSMRQVPINIGDEPYDPLFPYGFGLTYE